MPVYLLDSNVFIQAHRLHYPFDVIPTFWSRLVELSRDNLIYSIDKVKKEICEKPESEDALSIWCRNDLVDSFFINTEGCVQAYSEISRWVAGGGHYTTNAISEFLKVDLADPWLIAHAMTNSSVIVTHEVSNPQQKNRIKIPEPCNRFGVRYISPITMLRELRVSI